MRIVTECLRLRPTYYLPILADIQPAKLCRKEANLSFAYLSLLDRKYHLYQLMVGSTTAHTRGSDLDTSLCKRLAARKAVQ